MKVLAASSEDFLQRMGKMYDGSSPLQGDCRSSVVKFLKSDRDVANQIHVIGFPGENGKPDTAVHVMATDDHGRPCKDVWGGKLQGKKYLVRVSPSQPEEELEVLRTVDVDHFLSEFTSSSVSASTWKFHLFKSS